MFLQSTLQGLFQYVQLLVQLRELLALPANFPDCVKHRGVVTAAKKFANFRQAFLGQFFRKVHRYLASLIEQGLVIQNTESPRLGMLRTSL